VLFDLRVDDDPEPITELRRLLARRRAYRLADEAEAALAAGRFDDALAALTDAHDLAPDDDQVWVNEALALFAAGDEESAEGLVRRALNANPGWSAFFERLYAAGFLAVDDARMGELRELVRRAWS
jgi:tetratricopeptide (TPR) repeat protein